MGYMLTAFMGWLFAVRNYGVRCAQQQVAPPRPLTPRRPVYRTIYTEPTALQNKLGQVTGRKTAFGTLIYRPVEFKEGWYDMRRMMLCRADGQEMSRFEFDMLPEVPRKTKRVIVGYIKAGAVPTPEDLAEYNLSALEAQQALTWE